MVRIKIDENTTVPIAWVASGFATLVLIVSAGAYWVSAVNSRLCRIEEKLGIPVAKSEGVGWFLDALAKERDRK